MGRRGRQTETNRRTSTKSGTSEPSPDRTSAVPAAKTKPRPTGRDRGPVKAPAKPVRARAPSAAGSEALARRHDADMEPFAVSATDIANLDDDQFRRFMRELLRNEAATCGAEFIDNPGDGADEGQDAETRRPEGGSATDTFIPLGVAVWQYKAEKKPPSESTFKKEIGKAKPSAVLKRNGSYCFVAQQPSKNESTKRDLLRKVARQKRYRAAQVNFYAQASLAERARRFPAMALLGFFRRPLDHVHNFEWWAETAQDVPFDLQSRKEELDNLVEFIRNARRPAHVRVIGPAGVGKTRLVLEALSQTGAHAATVYAPNPHGSTFTAFYRWATWHRREIARLVLVVDECDEATAMRLRGDAFDHELAIVLITINKVEDPDIRSSAGDLRIHLAPMTGPDVTRIIQGAARLDQSVLMRIADITGGFVKLAIVVAKAIARDPQQVFNTSTLVTTDTVRHAVANLPGLSEEAMLWLSGVALFSEIRTIETDADSDIALLSAFLGVDARKVERWHRDAVTAQVLSDRGERVFVTPALLAVWLATDLVRSQRKRLAEWLATVPNRLQSAFSAQLGQLGYWEDGRALARQLIASDGPFGDLLLERQTWARSTFLALGTVCRSEALARLEGWVRNDETAALELATDSYMDRILFRLLWRPEHFARSLDLILLGLGATTTPERSGLLRILTGSMRIVLANSRATFPERFDVAARTIRDPRTKTGLRRLLMRALASGIDSSVGDSYSSHDVDIDGRFHWHPATWGEWWHCARLVADLLVEELSNSDAEMRHEAAALLIDHTAQFIRLRAHAPLLDAVDTVLSIDPRVGTLREEFERTLAFDNLPEDVEQAVRAAIDRLPKDLVTRIRVLTEGWPLVQDREKRGLPGRPEPDAVAAEIMNAPERDQLLGMLFEPWAKNTGDLFIALGKRTDAVAVWPAILAAATRSGETWGAALFLAIAKDSGHEPLQRVPRDLLSSSERIVVSLGAEAITRCDATEEDVIALIEAVRTGAAISSDLRYAATGRWTERRAAMSVANLVRACAAQAGGGPMAVAIAFAAGRNHGLSDEEVMDLLAASMFDVRGHDAWTWQQLGNDVATRAPEKLGRALVRRIGLRSRDRKHRFERWNDDEAAYVLARCIDAVPSLALELLVLWDDAPEFAERFASGAITQHVDATQLGEWASDDRRQRALAKFVLASPHPTTESLLARFGAASAFGDKLRSELYPKTWSGSLAALLTRRAEAAKAWATDPSRTTTFRAWASRAADWLHDAAVEAKRYDDDIME